MRIDTTALLRWLCEQYPEMEFTIHTPGDHPATDIQTMQIACCPKGSSSNFNRLNVALSNQNRRFTLRGTGEIVNGELVSLNISQFPS